jgi:hypothetical protein
MSYGDAWAGDRAAQVAAAALAHRRDATPEAER